MIAHLDYCIFLSIIKSEKLQKLDNKFQSELDLYEKKIKFYSQLKRIK